MIADGAARVYHDMGEHLPVAVQPLLVRQVLDVDNPLSALDSGGPAGTEEAALLESFVEIDLLPWLGRFTTALYEEGATYYGLLADLAEGLLGVVRAFSPSASTCAA